MELFPVLTDVGEEKHPSAAQPHHPAPPECKGDLRSTCEVQSIEAQAHPNFETNHRTTEHSPPPTT